MHRILICDALESAGLEILRESGADVCELEPAERKRLVEIVGEFDALIVRSTTQVTAEVLRAGRRLKVVGRAGIGVDNIDVATATELGVMVVNAPTANLLSATEHTFALLLALSRRVPSADVSLKSGAWDRKSFLGQELHGKTLGVVGFGQIGQRVAARAKAFEMEVITYDPYLDGEVARRLDVEPVELEELLGRSDVVTFHTPLTSQTRGMLNAKRIKLMKPGALVINCARGGVVDEEALLAALESGQIGGAALDVFTEEPPASSGLVHHPRVVATPHIGAQTHEAQERVATETARMVLAALNGSLAVSAVNLPFRASGTRGEPFLGLAEQLGHLASAILEASVHHLQVDLWGIDEALRIPLTVAVLKGALTPFLGEAVNYVNAETVAADRGIEVVRATHTRSGDFAQLIGVTLRGEAGEVELAGTLYGERDPRVVRFFGFRLEFRPEGRLLVLRNRDVPGVVGKLGTLLGEAGVNIAEIHLARQDSETDALAVLRLDQEPSPQILKRLSDLPEVSETHFLDLGG